MRRRGSLSLRLSAQHNAPRDLLLAGLRLTQLVLSLSLSFGPRNKKRTYPLKAMTKRPALVLLSLKSWHIVFIESKYSPDNLSPPYHFEGNYKKKKKNPGKLLFNWRLGKRDGQHRLRIYYGYASGGRERLQVVKWLLSAKSRGTERNDGINSRPQRSFVCLTAGLQDSGEVGGKA